GTLLDQLDQHALHGPGVEEGDGGAAGADPGRRVDHLETLAAQGGDGGGHVGHGVADVVDALASLGQVAADRGVGAEGGDQLHERLAGAEQQLVDALLLDHLLVGDLQAQHLLIEGAGHGQVGNGDADVVEASKLHGRSFQVASSRIQSLAVWSRSQPAPAAARSADPPAAVNSHRDRPAGTRPRASSSMRRPTPRPWAERCTAKWHSWVVVPESNSSRTPPPSAVRYGRLRGSRNRRREAPCAPSGLSAAPPAP